MDKLSLRPRSVQNLIQSTLAHLQSKSTQRDRGNLARFGITAAKFFGVSMANMKPLARGLGRDHELAAGLWETGWYEARMAAALVDEPRRVTPGANGSVVQGLQ